MRGSKRSGARRAPPPDGDGSALSDGRQLIRVIDGGRGDVLAFRATEGGMVQLGSRFDSLRAALDALAAEQSPC